MIYKHISLNLFSFIIQEMQIAFILLKSLEMRQFTPIFDPHKTHKYYEVKSPQTKVSA